MFRLAHVIFSTVFISSSLVWAAASLSIDQIPDGYRHGRPDAIYGTYTSVFQDHTRNYQDRLSYLDRKAFGLSSHPNQDAVAQSELQYLMEAEALHLFMDVINDKDLPQFEKQSLTLSTIRVYENVRKEGERLFEDMVRYIDEIYPGPNGLQIRIDNPTKGESLYYPNYRSDRLLSEEEKSKAYQDKMMEFISGGGQLSEMKELTGATIKSFGNFARVEYVVREDGSIWVTEGKAGHLLLSEGGAVKAAGQFLIIKDNNNKVQLAVVSNASGTFKPDLSSLFNTAVTKKLHRIIHAPRNQLVETRGEPLSTQAVKIYLKGTGLDSKSIKRIEAGIVEQGKNILFKNSLLACEKVYSL